MDKFFISVVKIVLAKELAKEAKREPIKYVVAGLVISLKRALLKLW